MSGCTGPALTITLTLALIGVVSGRTHPGYAVGRRKSQRRSWCGPPNQGRGQGRGCARARARAKAKAKARSGVGYG